MPTWIARRRKGKEDKVAAPTAVAANPSVPLSTSGDPHLDDILWRRRILALQHLEAMRGRFPRRALSPAQARFTSDDTLLRYLEARDGDLDKAELMLKETLKWRAEHVDNSSIECPACASQPNAHCFFPIGLDSRGWKLVYSCASRAMDRRAESSVIHMSRIMEQLFDKGAAAGKIVWIIDMHGFGWKDMDTSMARTAVPFFSNHYPERMGQIVLLDPPAIFKGFWDIVSSLVDPVTRRKVCMLRADKAAYFEKYLDEAQRAFMTAVLKTPPVPGSYPHAEMRKVATAPARARQP